MNFLKKLFTVNYTIEENYIPPTTGVIKQYINGRWKVIGSIAENDININLTREQWDEVLGMLEDHKDHDSVIKLTKMINERDNQMK